MKFDDKNGWNVLCSLMDVLNDTELAKENFIKYGIGGPTKISDIGEQYLRLYGITNSIYLQKSAVLAFIECLEKFKNADLDYMGSMSRKACEKVFSVEECYNRIIDTCTDESL